jgi:hypothetical protein
VVDRVASAVTYASGASLVVFGMELSDLALVVGIAVTVITYLTNVCFKYKLLQIARKQGVNLNKEDE